MKNLKYLLILVLVPLILIPILSYGRDFRMALLPDKGRNFGCGTCHINPAGGGARNPFGRDWEAMAIPKGDKYVPELSSRDSDGDGFTNDEEFNANKHPGDPNSKPEKPRAIISKGKLPTFWGKIKSRGSR